MDEVNLTGPNFRVGLEQTGELDEVVLNTWFHLERMNDVIWWMRIGDDAVFVTFEEGKKPEVRFEKDYHKQGSL